MCQHIQLLVNIFIKKKKAVVLKNADLLLESVDGILDHDTINTFRKKESFFDR